MQRIPVILEIRSKLEQLRFIRNTITSNDFDNSRFEKEEKKVKKQYFHKNILTNCLSYSKTDNTSRNTKSCSNSRISGSTFCYKHHEDPVTIYEDEFVFLIYNLNQFLTRKVKVTPNSCNLSYNLLDYKEFVNFSRVFIDEKLHDVFKMCGKRLKINPNNTEDMLAFTPTEYLERLEVFYKIKKPSEPLVLSQQTSKSRCMARINSGRQCINQVYYKNDYCSLHSKKIPYGDIRKAPPIKIKTIEEKQQCLQVKETNRILNNLNTVIKVNTTKPSQYTYRNRNYTLSEGTILKLVPI